MHTVRFGNTVTYRFERIIICLGPNEEPNQVPNISKLINTFILIYYTLVLKLFYPNYQFPSLKQKFKLILKNIKKLTPIRRAFLSPFRPLVFMAVGPFHFGITEIAEKPPFLLTSSTASFGTLENNN